MHSIFPPGALSPPPPRCILFFPPMHCPPPPPPSRCILFFPPMHCPPPPPDAFSFIPPMHWPPPPPIKCYRSKGNTCVNVPSPARILMVCEWNLGGPGSCLFVFWALAVEVTLKMRAPARSRAAPGKVTCYWRTVKLGGSGQGHTIRYANGLTSHLDIHA